jgi:hypothetical protein
MLSSLSSPCSIKTAAAVECVQRRRARMAYSRWHLNIPWVCVTAAPGPAYRDRVHVLAAERAFRPLLATGPRRSSREGWAAAVQAGTRDDQTGAVFGPAPPLAPDALTGRG